MKRVLTNLIEQRVYYSSCLIGAYLLMILVELLTSTPHDIFLSLAPISTLSLGIFFVVGSSLILFTEKIPAFSISKVNILLTNIVLLIAIYKSMSFFLSLGLLLSAFVLYTGSFLRKEKLSLLYLLVIVFSTPRLLTLATSNFQDTALKFHTFNLADTRFNIIIWSVIFATILSGAVLLLIHNSPIKQYLERYRKLLTYVILSLATLYVVYLSVVFVYKVKTFDGSTFDIGLFSQMFHRMSTDLSAITTLERDRVLSHFAVHISPIFYLMLPFYKLFPHVETLEVLQIWVVFSAVIPLRLLLSKLNLSKLANILTILWFVLLPVLTTAGGYHLHENCFLVPLIFWVFYFIVNEKKWGILISTILLLLVKEDAFIYVFSIGIFFLTQKRFNLTTKTKKWLIITEFLLPVLYFTLALLILSTFGEGGMVSRFDAFLLKDESGILTVFKNLILHPSFAISHLFMAKKLGYLFLMLAPMCFLPLLQRNWSTYFLAIPLVVINLLPDWPYQYDIGFQYSYGSGALLFIMALLALEDLKEHKLIKEKMVISVIFMGIIFSGTFLHRFTHAWSSNITYYQQNKDKYEAIKYGLEILPEDASIVAEGGYTPALRKHRALYDIFYHNQRKADPSIDYVVIPREQKGKNDVYDPLITSYETLGYKESKYATKELFILEKPE